MLASRTLAPNFPLANTWKKLHHSSQYRIHLNHHLPLSSPCPFHAHSSSSSSTGSSEPIFVSSVGIPTTTVTQWNLSQRHVRALSATACVVAFSASWLFLSAIPTLLAFKKAAESLEKLLDVTREELPNTMAAVRLTGMEISDLTMELSDLGQEITEGVRNSTRAVRIAEERLRYLTNVTAPAFAQEKTLMIRNRGIPAAAKAARTLRDGIIKSRAILRSLIGLLHFSRWIMNSWAIWKQREQLPK